MKKRRICSCALVNGHSLNCPFILNKNQFIGGETEKGLEIDFSSLAKMLKEMVKKVQEEKSLPLRKRKRIFVAPVLKKIKK